MIKIKVDGKELEVPDHYTLLQAAEEAGAEIPRFCFHERLSIAGNCRMCMIEIKGGPLKPQASCAMTVKDLRPGPNGEPAEFFTNTPMVQKARKGAIEFLLINHPLDCPICDQGGECDLQDQTYIYGCNKTRYEEDKRAVEDKNFGPLIQTKMTRCIHCTRCVRFITEIAGVPEMGLIGRGEDAEITTYLEKSITSELQGNLIDLCPVGALTSKPYAFNARSWELNKTETIDVMDAMGCAIRVDSRGREVMRILPRINEEINEEWISDKTRFVYDGLKLQRLDRPYIRNQENKLVPTSFEDAFLAIKNAINKNKSQKIGALIGDLTSVEETYALKNLMNALQSNFYDCRQDLSFLHPENGKASYLFNSTIEGLEDADLLLLIGTNIQLEAPVLGARIRKWQKRGNYPIGIIGDQQNFYPTAHYLGDDIHIIKALSLGNHQFSDLLKEAKKPLIILGGSALIGADAKKIFSNIIKLAEDANAIQDDWKGFSILHHAASRVGALELGFVPKDDSNAKNIVEESDILFLLGADEIDLTKKKAFTIYIGTHGDNGAHHADVILPGAAYTEKSGIYMNMEGRPQMGTRVCFAPGDAKEDWAILRALSETLDIELPYDNLDQLRAKLLADYPQFGEIDKISFATKSDFEKLLSLKSDKDDLENCKVTSFVKDFYLTNPIARASKILTKCSAMHLNHCRK